MSKFKIAIKNVFKWFMTGLGSLLSGYLIRFLMLGGNVEFVWRGMEKLYAFTFETFSLYIFLFIFLTFFGMLIFELICFEIDEWKSIP